MKLHLPDGDWRIYKKDNPISELWFDNFQFEWPSWISPLDAKIKLEFNFDVFSNFKRKRVDNFKGVNVPYDVVHKNQYCLVIFDDKFHENGIYRYYNMNNIELEPFQLDDINYLIGWLKTHGTITETFHVSPNLNVIKPISKDFFNSDLFEIYLEDNNTYIYDKDLGLSVPWEIDQEMLTPF